MSVDYQVKITSYNSHHIPFITSHCIACVLKLFCVGISNAAINLQPINATDAYPKEFEHLNYSWACSQVHTKCSIIPHPLILKQWNDSIYDHQRCATSRLQPWKSFTDSAASTRIPLLSKILRVWVAFSNSPWGLKWLSALSLLQNAPAGHLQ